MPHIIPATPKANIYSLALRTTEPTTLPGAACQFAQPFWSQRINKRITMLGHLGVLFLVSAFTVPAMADTVALLGDGLKWDVSYILDDFGTDFVRLSVSHVPIPDAVWLFGSGLIGLFGLARHKIRV